MNITLLEPTASVLGHSTYAAHNILEPLGIEYVASYLETKGHTCHVVQQRCRTRESVIAEIVELYPDVLGISTLTYNIDDALWFAGQIKKILPKIVVILGGYHATAMPELAKRPEVDFVVLGEGEAVIAELINTLKDGQESLSHIRGISFYDSALHVNPRAERIADLDTLPFPKRDRKILSECRMHGLMCPPAGKQTNVATITATRGCPYHCSFCSSQLIWNRDIRRRSPGQVAEELEFLVEEYGVNAVFFSDLTFNASKKYTINLCNEIARRDIPIYFYAMCNLRGMDREIAEAMAAAKCTKIGFGVESFIDEVRANMKDRGGMNLEQTNKILQEVCAGGVLTKAYFIIGFPWETLDSLSQLKNDIAQIHADEIKVTFYAPFPGTPGYDQHRSLLTTTDWSEFTTLTKPIVRNEDVTVEQYQQIRVDIFNSFYNGKFWQERSSRRVKDFPQYADSFVDFREYLREKNILRTPVAS